MERVLYNTIAGATPILADGTTFYYSDYNREGRKVHYCDKRPCCSGTFPQLTADYGISAYYKGDDGVHVNLFIPSKVSWSQKCAQISLTQTTEYPRDNVTQMGLSLAQPQSVAVRLRIPGWAGAKTVVRVNDKDKKVEETLEPWKDGDRIAMELEMPLRLEAIDDQNQNNVALVRGPLALFAAGNIPPKITRKHLLSAAAVGQTSDDWAAQTDNGTLTLRPFAAIMSEEYRLYHRVVA